MNIKEIEKLQKKQGFYSLQLLINSGEIWKFSGSEGRYAMECLNSGACYLPLFATYDYYDNRIPARTDLKNGTKGTLLNSINYYSNL